MLPCEADQERHHTGPGHPPCHDVTTTITHNTIGNVVGDGASIVMELRLEVTRLEERLAAADRLLQEKDASGATSTGWPPQFTPALRPSWVGQAPYLGP
jgi:hypothetical protein